MVESTKIKFFTIAGTIAIISTSYILHANSFYTQMYKNGEKIKDIYSKKVDQSNSDTLKITKLKPSKIVEEESILPVKMATINNKALEKDNRSIKIKEQNEKKIKQKNSTVEKEEIQNSSTTIEVVEVKEPILEKVTTVTATNPLHKLSTFKEYLYLDNNGSLTKETKKILDELIPLINKLADHYIEVEGYSAKSTLAKKLSQKYAKEVANYLKLHNINKKVVVTSYADEYPIIDDLKDIRNSRVELKFRKETN